MIKNQKGLGLIEVLAVCVIVGLLYMMLLPTATKIINNSKADYCDYYMAQAVSTANMYEVMGDSQYTTKDVVDINKMVSDGLISKSKIDCSNNKFVVTNFLNE